MRFALKSCRLRWRWALPACIGSSHENSPASIDASCAAHPKCVALGLDEGGCCPTSEGDELWCCED